MLYSIFIYGSEAAVEDGVLGRHAELRKELAAQGRLGPAVRLVPDSATTMRRAGDDEPLITDGPFAETKEQLMGLVDCPTLEDALETARRLAFDTAVFEIRPIAVLEK